MKVEIKIHIDSSHICNPKIVHIISCIVQADRTESIASEPIMDSRRIKCIHTYFSTNSCKDRCWAMT